MGDEPLRQPRTFWQWLTNQPGTLFVPPPPPIVKVNPPRAPMDFIDDELRRIHSQIDDFRSEGIIYMNTEVAVALVRTLSKLHDELIRRSKEENNEAVSAR